MTVRISLKDLLLRLEIQKYQRKRQEKESKVVTMTSDGVM